MRIALVHDYLTQRGGAERVFEMFCRQFPDADIFTSVYDPERTIELRQRLVNTTLLQSIPGARRYFRLFAPLYFTAFRMLDLSEYDLIISSSSSFSKSVRKRPDAHHICFCHNVTRFLWDTDTYLRGYQSFESASGLLEPLFSYMRQLDITYAEEPDLYVANSTIVEKRISKIYRQPVITINYPIDEKRFTFSAQKEDFYLVSCRLLSYKRVDIIVEAFNRLGWPLIITGRGPERKRLESMAADNIQFVGHVSDEERRRLFSQAKLVVVAALEDYGLVPIEANVSGTPVIAYGAGGVLDSQIPGKTGLFFAEQTADSLCSVLVEAQSRNWNYKAIHQHAMENFSEAAFFDRVKRLINRQVASEQISQLSADQALSSIANA
ncbi:MAG: glycosyltransferase [Phormidesmis sp.]